MDAVEEGPLLVSDREIVGVFSGTVCLDVGKLSDAREDLLRSLVALANFAYLRFHIVPSPIENTVERRNRDDGHACKRHESRPQGDLGICGDELLNHDQEGRREQHQKGAQNVFSLS